MLQSTSPENTMPPTKPPGPVLQKLNALLHEEPLATMVHGYYWSIFLVFWTPIALLVLQVTTIFRLVNYLLGWTGAGECDPRKNTHMEMAIVITGCDSGFGKEIALWAAADCGFTVFAACLCDESLEKMQLPNIIPVKMDVTRNEDIIAVVEKVSAWLKEESKGKKKRVLHGLINNAGIGLGGDIDWLDLDDFQKCMDVNYMGTVRCCKSFMPIFIDQSSTGLYKKARILNIISMAGMVTGSCGLAAYHASKHAARAFTVNLRLELTPFDIQVTAVNPSFHGTPIVSAMTDQYTRKWDMLPLEKKQIYGEAYLKRALYVGVDIPHSYTWKAHVVIDQVMKCLKSRNCPPELIIGSDARFVLVAMRMLPEWCVDFILRLQGRPVPYAMKH